MQRGNRPEYDWRYSVGKVWHPNAGARSKNYTTRRKSAAGLAREIQRLSLHLAHPRYLAQQVAAPIPLAALIESVAAAMNQSLAVWEMSPIATAIDRQVKIGRAHV